MTDLTDFDIDERPAAPEPPPPPRYESERSPLIWVALAIALGAIAAGVSFWLNRSPGDPGTTTTEADVAPAARPAPAAEPIDIPPLDQSDAAVRKLVAALSSHPTVAAWLTTNGLIRNFVVVVENIAYGQLPTGHLRALRPQGRYVVLERDGEIAVDPATYERFNGIAGAVASIDTAGAARLYAGLRPRLNEAYAELGRQEPFDRAMERALANLLAVPIPAGPVRLQPLGAVEYEYADPRLARLSQPQKQLLRMGPRNMEVIQRKLRELAAAIGIQPTLR